MSNTEKTEISDLRRYMEHSLAEHYTQVITFKDREDSFVSLYAHKDTGQKMLLRRSGNRNDGVYRALRASGCVICLWFWKCALKRRTCWCWKNI